MIDAKPQEGPTPRALDTAPRNGAMLRLWVRYPEGGSWTPLDDARESWTVGFNNFDNTEDDRWQIVGWCWSHDHLVEAADDVEVLGWLPFHGETSFIGSDVEGFREALVQADLKIRSLPGTDQSDVDFIRAVLDRPVSVATKDVFRPDDGLFDLLEGVADRLRQNGEHDKSNTLRAFFARGTGGADIADLIDILAGSA